MSTKQQIEYLYQTREDYNKTVRIDGKKLCCYSKDKLPELFPNGGYSFVGEIYNGNTSDNAGTLKTDNGDFPLSVVRGNRKERLIDIGYIQVGEKKFVAVMKKAGLPIWFWIGLIALILAVAIIPPVIIINNMTEDPVNPEELDPHITPIETELVTISGKVTYGGNPVENAVLTLYLGRTEISKATTDKDGKYLISKVEDGAYNLVASYEKSSTTKAVIVNKLSVVQDFQLTASDLNVRIEIPDDKTPDIAVNGLDYEAEKYAVAGKYVDVTLIAKKLEEADVTDADHALIAQKSGDTVLTYFDFSIYREVFDLSGTSQEKSNISETDDPIEIIIAYDSSYDVGTYVFRVYNGESVKFTELDERPTENYVDGTYYVTADYVFIYTKYFSSTFAIGSASAGNVTKGSDTITYSDKAYVNLNTNKIEMLYRHDADSTNNVRLEMYLVGNNGNLLISESGTIPPGNELKTMVLLDNISGMPSVGTYEGLLKIIYLGTDGNTATNVDIPLSVAIVK